ncbi:hypothetical protein HN51_055017 [Arachis hypogaea]
MVGIGTSLQSSEDYFFSASTNCSASYNRVQEPAARTFPSKAVEDLEGSTVEMIDLDRDDAGSEDANLLFSGHRARITYIRDPIINSGFHHVSGVKTASIRYTFSGGMFEMNEVKGGSPYDARTYASGDGSRQPTKLDLEQAFHQGKYIATITKKLKKE